MKQKMNSWLTRPKKDGKPLNRNLKDNIEYYLLMAIPLILIFIFSYLPMYGIQIAFKSYSPRKGIWGSDWVGLENWMDFFGYYQ